MKVRRILSAVLILLLLVGCGGNGEKALSPGVKEVYQETEILRMEITEVTGDTIRYRVVHGREHGQTAGISPYPALEVYRDGWFALKPLRETGQLSNEIALEPEQSRDGSFEFVPIYGTLSPGKYRMVLEAHTGERRTVYLAAEFDVK